MAWIYLADTEESPSPCPNGCGPLHTVKSKSIVRGSCYPKWTGGTSQELQFGITCKHSTGISYPLVTSYMVVSHAKTSLLQELEEAWQVSEVDFFMRSCGWPKKSDPDSYSLKTSLESGKRHSIPLSGNWPISGTIADGVLYPLKPLGHLTKGKDGSFLQNKWATPTVQDAKNNGGPSQWNRNSAPLNVQVQKFPTPTCMDAANKPRGPRKPHPGGGQKPPLLSVVGDKLNPDWVELLMGLPVGWTKLTPWIQGWFQTPGRKAGKKESQGQPTKRSSE